MTKITLTFLEIVLLLFLTFFVYDSYSEKNCNNNNRTEDDSMESNDQEPEDFTCTCDMPPPTEYNDVCFPIIFQKIKDSDDKISLKTLENTNNINAFLECMSCIAIAKELSKAICLHNKRFEKVSHMRRDDVPCFLDLEDVCTHNFIGFDLQDKKSMRVLAPSSFNGRHVPVQNINWNKKLEELCLVYVSHYGIENIHEELFTNSDSGLIDELCNKTGVFGSCQSIEVECNSKLL